VTRITIVREKRLNCFFECGICLGRSLSRSIGALRAAVKHEERDANERAQIDELSPEILPHHGFLQWRLALRRETDKAHAEIQPETATT
jgi:hypothetical protein